MCRCYPLTLVALLVSTFPAPARAQASDADAREVRSYRLSMPKLRQLNQVMLDVAKQHEADPRYQGLARKKAELKRLQGKEELTAAEEDRLEQLEREVAEAEDEEGGGDTKSLGEFVRRIEASPPYRAALRKAGLPAREAAVMLFALFEAGFTAELLESGAIKEIPKTANADNVKLYQANKAELKAMEGLSKEAVD